MATTVIKKTTVDSKGLPPEYWPLRMSGACQTHQISALKRTGRGRRASIKRVSM